MVDKETLKKLEDLKLIDQRYLLWWNLGFEGRRIYDKEEFDKGLTEVTYNSIGSTRDDFDVKPRTFRVWQNENVPILIKEINYQDVNFSVFVTVKPLHTKNLEYNKQFESSVQVNEEPHIRGVVAELTKDHLFWFPITYGEPQFFYDTTRTRNLEGVEEKVLSHFLHPSTFWKNQIKCNWYNGKRSQTKSKKLNLEDNYDIVPYYNFDPNENHIMIYPGKIFGDRLDLPIIVKGKKGNNSGIPKILGVGYFTFDEFSFDAMSREDCVYYWKLDNSFERKVKRSLITRLGDLSRKS